MGAKMSGKTFEEKQDFPKFRVSLSSLTAKGKRATLQGRNLAGILTKLPSLIPPVVRYIDIMNSLMCTEENALSFL